jgi:hypothetical protein
LKPLIKHWAFIYSADRVQKRKYPLKQKNHWQ